jgi:hypothetical protein
MHKKTRNKRPEAKDWEQKIHNITENKRSKIKD